ncbi:MAG: tetratricopeptide repeat protein [Deltaproteobacteria bacterium]|nr:tetratricopeptide repeat protein [Deltaproteobacteria bacterium]
MGRLTSMIFILSLWLIGASPVMAHNDSDEGDKRIHPIQLVKQLINNGNLEEAKKLLNGLEGDKAVIESFRGIIAMRENHVREAITHFKNVLATKPNQTAIWLYLGQAYYQLGKFGKSLSTLNKGEKIGRRFPSYFQIKARVQEKLGKVEEAYTTLENAITSFPRHYELLREQALLLVNEGLYAAALEKGSTYLDKVPNDRDGYLVLGEALRKAGSPGKAAVILEKAALRFKQDPQVLARLAFAYSTGKHLLAAARLFARATLLGGDYAFAAAEHFRLAGHFHEAVRLNARVKDSKKRLSQRLAIYLGSERFERAAALEKSFSSIGPLDDTTRYRLAYADLRIDELDRAENLCKKIKDRALKDSASKLIDVISRQRKEQGENNSQSSSVRP